MHLPKPAPLLTILGTMAEHFKNILIIKPSALGDIVMALPALDALHMAFPNAKISWLIRPEFAPLIENHPHIDEIIIFDRKSLAKTCFKPTVFTALFALFGKLRQKNFDAVIDLQGLFRTAGFAWLSRSRKRFGPAKAREFAHLLYTDRVPIDDSCIHVVDYYMKIARAAGAPDTPPRFYLPVSKHTSDSANQLLGNRNIDPDNYAVIIPGSTHTHKCWPVERFAEIADKITNNFNLPIIATGTLPENAIIEQLQSMANVPVLNLAGRTSLPQLTALLKNSKLVVSNDTGPGQLAGALAAPLVIIFGPSNPIRIFPYGRKHCVAAVEPYTRGLAIKNNDPRYDINAVSIDLVYEKVCEQLAAGHCQSHTT